MRLLFCAKHWRISVYHFQQKVFAGRVFFGCWKLNRDAPPECRLRVLHVHASPIDRNHTMSQHRHAIRPLFRRTNLDRSWLETLWTFERVNRTPNAQHGEQQGQCRTDDARERTRGHLSRMIRFTRSR